jgi:phage gp16-like protein
VTARAAVSEQALRGRELAQIHIARADLHLDDDEYRSILRQVTGADSAAKLDAAGRARVLAHFKACGWAPKPKAFSQAEKIEWFWKQLAQTGVVHDPSPAGLLAFVCANRKLMVSHLKFLPVRDASVVIEVLKAWLKRARAQR